MARPTALISVTGIGVFVPLVKFFDAFGYVREDTMAIAGSDPARKISLRPNCAGAE